MALHRDLLLALLWAASPWAIADGSASKNASQAKHNYTHVYITRHCVRSDKESKNTMGYTTLPFPDWNTPAGWCTERGMDIIKKTGAQLVKDYDFPSDSSKVKIVGHIDSQRCIDTALGLAKGMGLESTAFQLRSTLFSSAKGKAKVCNATPADIILEDRQERFLTVKQPWDVKAAVKELQGIIGEGPSGPLPTSGYLDKNGQTAGAFHLLASFGQMMFFASASNISFVPPGVTQEQINRFLAWQYFHRSIEAITTDHAVEKGAALLASTLVDLQESEHEANIYAGHDGNLDGIAAGLNLTWTAPPYIMSGDLVPTLPGSALHFKLDHTTGAVSLSYVYPVFNEPEAGDFDLKSNPIKTYNSVKELSDAIAKGLKARQGAWECFKKFSPETSEIGALLV